jgi:diguanylate cyclase (GGDEF)-like protein
MAVADTPLADESPIAQAQQRGYRWLRFPQPLELQYREDHRANAHGFVRMSLIVAFITFSGFALIDHWVINAINVTPDIVRYGLQLPVLAICLLATARRFYLRWYEAAIMVGAPLFGLGTVIMTCYAPAANIPLIGARLLLVSFFFYFMLGLRLRHALFCNALVFVSFVAAAVLGLIPAAIGTYLTFALLCANIIGGSGAYALEHANRTAFLDRLSLEEMAARDGLTRLLNRQTFEFRARNQWRTATTLQRPVAILMIDVDYFKRFNDHYGHQAGDECLRRIAAAVREAINPSRDELVARYGGEELIALLIDRSSADVEIAARNIVEHIVRQAIPHQASIVGEIVSVSVGATTPSIDPSMPFNALVNIADKALYTAKHQGRNRCVVLDPQSVSGNLSALDSEGITRPEARALLQREAGTFEGTAAV